MGKGTLRFFSHLGAFPSNNNRSVSFVSPRNITQAAKAEKMMNLRVQTQGFASLPYFPLTAIFLKFILYIMKPISYLSELFETHRRSMYYDY